MTDTITSTDQDFTMKLTALTLRIKHLRAQWRAHRSNVQCSEKYKSALFTDEGGSDLASTDIHDLLSLTVSLERTRLALCFRLAVLKAPAALLKAFEADVSVYRTVRRALRKRSREDCDQEPDVGTDRTVRVMQLVLQRLEKLYESLSTLVVMKEAEFNAQLLMVALLLVSLQDSGPSTPEREAGTEDIADETGAKESGSPCQQKGAGEAASAASVLRIKFRFDTARAEKEGVDGEQITPGQKLSIAEQAIKGFERKVRSPKGDLPREAAIPPA